MKTQIKLALLAAVGAAGAVALLSGVAMGAADDLLARVEDKLPARHRQTAPAASASSSAASCPICPRRSRRSRRITAPG